MGRRALTGDLKRLLVVCANPPLTSGERTTARCALATRLLGFDSHEIGNLVDAPSRDVVELSELGRVQSPWTDARAALRIALGDAAGVLFAYGVSAPSGPARGFWRDQIDWLGTEVTVRGLPVWQVGDGPRHPSRWQRFTRRAHPTLTFTEALAVSLGPVTILVDPVLVGGAP